MENTKKLLSILTEIKDLDDNYKHPRVIDFFTSLPQEAISQFLTDSMQSIFDISVVGKQYHLGGLLFITSVMNRNYEKTFSPQDQEKIIFSSYQLYLRLEEKKNEGTEKTYENMQEELVKFLSLNTLTPTPDLVNKLRLDFSTEFKFKNSKKVLDKLFGVVAEKAPKPKI